MIKCKFYKCKTFN